jgi:hypothetical protein
MPSYQTARLQQYEPRFLEVAEDLFERVRRQVPERQIESHKGSFSVYGQSGKDTAAKIDLGSAIGRNGHVNAVYEVGCLYLGTRQWSHW